MEQMESQAESQAETPVYAVRQCPAGAWLLICPDCADTARAWGDEVKEARFVGIRCAICMQEQDLEDFTA